MSSLAAIAKSELRVTGLANAVIDGVDNGAYILCRSVTPCLPRPLVLTGKSDQEDI